MTNPRQLYAIELQKKPARVHLPTAAGQPWAMARASLGMIISLDNRRKLQLTNSSSPSVGHGAGVSGDELPCNEPGGAAGAVLRKEAGQVVGRLEPVDVACTQAAARKLCKVSTPFVALIQDCAVLSTSMQHRHCAADTLLLHFRASHSEVFAEVGTCRVQFASNALDHLLSSTPLYRSQLNSQSLTRALSAWQQKAVASFWCSGPVMKAFIPISLVRIQEGSSLGRMSWR